MIHNLALQFATEEGNIEIVKLLLQDPRVDPADEKNLAIIYASQNGYFEIVQLLLQDPRVDPSDIGNVDFNYKNAAITEAFNNNHMKIVDLLLEDPRVVNHLIVDTPLYKYAIRGQHKKIIETTIALKSLGLPPYVLGQILSYSAPAYDVNVIGYAIQPILEAKSGEEFKLRRKPIELRPGPSNYFKAFE